MGLIDKIKGIIFIDDQEADEDTAKKTEEKKKEEVTKSESDIAYTEYKPPVVSREEKRSQSAESMISKIDDEEEEEEPKKETFPFPDFDEDEFSQVSAPTIPKKSTNVMDYERDRLKKSSINDKPKKEYSRLEKVENNGEKKRFKNSPIISPVFGVLNEDYVIDDVVNRGEEPARKGDLDVQSVRDKAFGVLDEKKNETEEVKTITKEEKEEKIKTIDEMLEDTADLKVTIDAEDEEEKVDFSKNFVDEEDDEENVEPTKEIKAVKDDDFDGEKDVDNDLFDLMESMYDSGEDDE